MLKIWWLCYCMEEIIVIIFEKIIDCSFNLLMLTVVLHCIHHISHYLRINIIREYGFAILFCINKQHGNVHIAYVCTCSVKTFFIYLHVQLSF